MECLLGVRFNDFVLVAADTVDARSIVVMKHDVDKFHQMSDKLLMAVTGEAGDTTQFAEFIQKNMQLYKMKNEYELSPKAAAFYTRKNLAEYLRSRSPYNCNLLIAGYDDVEKKPELFFIDYLASCASLPYCAHGYGGHFTLGTMDAYYKPDFTPQEGYNLLEKCVKEISKRLIINLPTFKVKIVDANGIRDFGLIEAKNLQ